MIFSPLLSLSPAQGLAFFSLSTSIYPKWVKLGVMVCFLGILAN